MTLNINTFAHLVEKYIYIILKTVMCGFINVTHDCINSFYFLVVNGILAKYDIIYSFRIKFVMQMQRNLMQIKAFTLIYKAYRILHASYG